MKTTHVRKDEELWLMFVASGEVYKMHRKQLMKSPSYRVAEAALSFAVFEKCIDDYNIPREKFIDIATHVLEGSFSKAQDRQTVINHYLHGDHSSEFHQAVAQAREYLQERLETEYFPKELTTKELNIPGL